MKKLLPLLFYLLLFENVFSQTIVSAPYYKMETWDTSPYLSYKVTGGTAYSSYDMPFRMLLPKNYDAANAAGYPLLLMLHGAGESAYGNNSFGLYPVGDPRRSNNDAQLHHLGREYMNAVSSGSWPGFVIFPQNPTGYWTSDARIMADAVEVVQTLMKSYKIDPNRICVAGLSAGAQAVWGVLSRYTTFFATGTPFSGISPASPSNTTQILHTPVWYFQGEVDVNPSQSLADKSIQAMRNVGATPIYTVFPETGHGTWAKAVSQPDYFPFLKRATKLKIHPYYGKTEFDNGEAVNVKMGLTPGFQGYEWRKDGVLIAGATSNEITATSLGSYTVRFKRGLVWTDWSQPCVLKIKTPPSIATQPASLNKIAGTTAIFQVIAGGTPPFTYQWQKNGVNIMGATDYTFRIQNVLKSDAGSYRVIVKNALGTATSNNATLSVTAALAGSIDTPAREYLYYGGETISYSGNGNDSKGGDLPAANFTWKLELRNFKGATVVWTRTGSKSGSWTVPTSLEIANNSYYRLYLTVKDVHSTNSVTIERTMNPKLTEIVLKTQPEGLRLKLDNSSLVTTKAFYAVEGTVRTLGAISPQTLNGVTYKFSYWSKGGAATQSITVPVKDVIYTAVYVNASTARLASEDINSQNSSLSIHPNPSANYLTITVQAKIGEKINLGIVNSVGKAVKTKVLTALTDGENTFTLDIGDLNNNSYILRIGRGKSLSYKHFIKNE